VIKENKFAKNADEDFALVSSINGSVSSTTEILFPVIVKDSLKVRLWFKPNRFDVFVDTLSIASDGGGKKIPLTGNSPYPVLFSSQSSLPFGAVARNSTKQLSLKLHNTSINTLTVDSIYTKTSIFTVDKNNGSAATDTLSMNIIFSPTAIGSFVDTLYLRNNSTTSLVKIPLSGNTPAPVITVSATVVDWSSVVKGIAQLKTVLVTNPSLSPLTIDSIFTMTKQFILSKTSATIAMGETLSLAVSFKPDTFAVYADTLYLRNNSLLGLVKIPLMGGSPLPILTISPNSYRKDTVAVGDSSAQVYMIKNYSINDLPYDTARTGSSQFKFIGAAKGLIRSNDSTIFTILFTPGSYGEFADTLSVTSFGIMAKIPLSGSSPYPKMVLSVSSLDFGNVRKDTVSKKTIVVKNTSINKLRIDSLKTKSAQFTVESFTSPVFVTKKDSAIFVVTFKADTLRKYNDTLNIYSNQQTPIVFAALSGSGTLTSVLFSDNQMPTVYELNQNFPNPFNPSTTLRYGLPNNSTVSLKIYNVLGQQVASLVNGEQSAGWQGVIWNANVSSGVYLYRLEAVDLVNPNNRFVQVKKMILLK
jgi:hypothetical protein